MVEYSLDDAKELLVRQIVYGCMYDAVDIMIV